MDLKAFFILVSLGLAQGLGDGRGQYYSQQSVPLAQVPLQLSDHFSSQQSAGPQAAPSPYSFGYSAEAAGGSSARQESSDAAGKVTGSYTVNNEDGSKRIVNYIADHQGFRAEIDTNEAGTKSDSPADVTLKSAAPASAYAPAPTTPKKSFAYEPKQYNGAAQQASMYTSGSSGDNSRPSPYSYSYQSQFDDGSSSHQENFDGSGKVKGSYSLAIADGRKRTVDYTADAGGFKASVQTNEFGTKSDNPADVQFLSSAPLDAPSGYSRPSSYSTQQISKANIFSQNGQRVQQSAIQPTQFDIGSAPEGKPFPYSFNYDNKWEDGGSARREDSDGSGKVTGSYSLSHSDGRRRNVDYSADAAGFRASVQTNEFGTKSDSPASVSFLSTALNGASAAQRSSLQSTRQSSASSFSSYKSSSQPLNQQPLQYNLGPAADARPSPYAFQYDNKWDDGSSSRSETSDGSGKVIGSYSLSHADGQKRTVDYTADASGFKASIQTNEFGTKSDSPADVRFLSSAVIPEAPQSPSYSAPRASSAVAYSSYQNQQTNQAPFQMNFGSAPEGKPFPYSFMYNNQWDDGSNSRSEKSDGSGSVVGSYSLSHKDGRRRTVDYSADSAGFKAAVQTNEFGTKSDSPADVKFLSSAVLDAPAQQLIRPYSAVQSSHAASSSSFQHSSQGLQQVKLSSGSDASRSPYAFQYAAEATGGASSRQEASDSSGKVTGSYSVTNEDGSKRVVEYIADNLGFRAKVKTNELGTKSGSPADVSVDSTAPEAAPAPQPYSQTPNSQKFPTRTYTPKSSMISQVKQEKIW